MSLVRQIFQRYYTYPAAVRLEEPSNAGKYSYYSGYHYLQPGLAPFMRTRHLEYALRLTRGYFHKANVIDFGCADGPFLPSLSKYFNKVLGIDNNPAHIKVASEVVRSMHLSNVELICNAGLTPGELKLKMPSHKYQILFLLETIEHIGDKTAPWDSRANLIKDLLGLIGENGIIVLSVPNMIGLPFLLQRLALSLFQQNREPISVVNVLRASLFNDTTRLEKQWDAGHIGFNHKKLENRLKKDFAIVKKRDIIFNIIYILRTHKAVINKT